MKTFITVIATIAGLCTWSLLTGAITMWLWNWLAVSLCGAPLIDFWTGWGISFAIRFVGNRFRGEKSIKINTKVS